MTDKEIKKAFEAHYDKWREENPQGIYHSFQAWAHQQAIIDALMQNTESMSQTNAALLKKLDNYDDNYMAEARKVGQLQTQLSLAVEALERIKDYKCITVNNYRDYDDEAFMCRELAQTALNQIKQ